MIVHLMTLKSEVAELHYEVAELSSGELHLTFTTVIDTFMPNFVNSLFSIVIFS